LKCLVRSRKASFRLRTEQLWRLSGSLTMTEESRAVLVNDCRNDRLAGDFTVVRDYSVLPTRSPTSRSTECVVTLGSACGVVAVKARHTLRVRLLETFISNMKTGCCVFSARQLLCYPRPSVCLSVCLSHGSISQKRL